MAVTSAVSDLVKSVAELFSSLVGAVYTIVHTFFAGILHLFSGFFAFIGDIFAGVLDLVGGLGKFITGNIVILGILAIGVYGYFHFTQQGQLQGRQSAKKIN
ncbi:hypothetical protein B0T17DRAFT_488754 [Bombardia bombarda]|uniref:Uncharacterized protein n=1 Tax=Bombardia bombarda TaxID=252184 RepID=A0AA39XBU1_9PEZI|nr:hypothetical protein B0T17DRAFT_488754 [Bombardia bombarda]